jgi:hypothetical protein
MKMKRSYVYFNLQRRVWSERQAGKVIDHPTFLILKDARFLVGKAGQARVRAEGRKNVHAGVSGIRDLDALKIDYLVEGYRHGLPTYKKGWREVVYNPYINETFVQRGGFEVPVITSPLVYMAINPLHNDDRPMVLALNPTES